MRRLGIVALLLTFIISFSSTVIAAEAIITNINGNQISIKNLKYSYKNQETIYGVWREALTELPFNKVKEIIIYEQNDKLTSKYRVRYLKTKLTLRTGKTIDFNIIHKEFFGISKDLGSEIRIDARDVKSIKFLY